MSKDYNAIAKEVAEGAAELSRSLPEEMRAFVGLGAAAYADGSLSRKVKELIALAIGVAVRCEGCIAHHSKACHSKGATRTEVIEAIGVAIHMGGGPSMVYGADALRAYDQFASE